MPETPSFRCVVVALAREESDRALVAYAGLLAGIEPSAEFHFVHVLDWPQPGQDPESVVRHEQALREIDETVAARLPAGVNARCTVLSGAVLDRLLEFTAGSGADVVLVGHRRRSRGRRSLARRLAMKAPASVWMVPEGCPARLRNVMAAVDFSEPSGQALVVAARIVRAAGVPQCLALHVQQGSSPARDSMFQRFLARVSPGDVRVEPLIERGSTVAEAVECLNEERSIDLIVMGTRGRSSSIRTLLGEETDEMMLASTVPVLAVKACGDGLDLLEALLDRQFLTAEQRQAG